MAETGLKLRGYDQSSRYDPVTMTRVVDVDMDEIDDIADFGEVPDAQSKGRGKRAVISLLVFICVAGITLSIVSGAVRKKISGNGGGAKPPSNLIEICAPNAVSTEKGYSACESVCAQAECCHLPADDSNSCAEEKADQCKGFDAHCAILSFDHNNDGKVEVQEHVEVPPAMSEIENLCQWDNLASTTGYNSCKDACMPGRCCYEDIETCKVTNPDMCDSYEVCEILHVQNMVTIPPALPNIADLCSPESLDDPVKFNQCKNACEPGECCLEPIEACKVQNPGMCGGYNACEILHGSPKSHPTSVESQVVTKCNTGALTSPEGIEACEDICKPAMCCFASSGVGNCNTPENAEYCSQYGACQTLQHIDDDGVDSHADAQAAVEEACSDSSPDGIAICSNVCAPAHCCFDGTQNCFKNGMDNLRCSHYDACGILYHNDKNPDTSVKPNPVEVEMDQNSMLIVAEHVADVCGGLSIATPDGKDECMRTCEDNLCCFAPGDYNCVKEHKEMCVVYAACENILRVKNPPDVESPKLLPSNPEHVEKPSGFEEQVSVTCSDDSLNTQEGFAKCHDICKAHMCCFSTDGMENCFVDHPVECDDYQPCAQLTMTNTDDSDDEEDSSMDEDLLTQEVVDELCDVSNLLSEEGFSDCETMCADHLCCFSPGGTKSNCMDTKGEDECLKYEGCSNLIMMDDGPVEMPSEATPDELPASATLTYVCSEANIDENGDGDCEMMCVDRECCYYDGPGNCKVTEEEWCEGSELCLELDVIQFNMFSYKCSVDWIEECQDMCEERSCCFNDGVGSCATTDAEWCEYADMCPDVNTESSYDDIDYNDLVDACDSSTFNEKNDIALCQSMCQYHLCCFSTDARSNCYDDHPLECEKYTPCDHLISTEPGDDVKSVSKETIDEICMGSAIATADGLSACHAACSQYLCCFSPVGTKSNCRDEVGEETCYKYSGCSNLLLIEGETDSNTNDFDEKCSMDTIMQDEGSACSDLCEDRTCCRQNNGAGCLVTTEGYCDGYDGCFNLINLIEMENKNGPGDNGAGDNGAGDNGAGDNGAGDNEVDTVLEACSSASIETPGGQAQCRDYCDPYLCCWTAIEENDCSAERPECVLYTEPCSRLGGVLTGTSDMDGVNDIDDYEPDDFAESLEVMCSETSLQSDYGIEMCREACIPHSCCFSDDAEENCSDNSEDKCQMYSACTNLHDFEGTVTQVQSATSDEVQEVMMACDIDNLNKYGTSQCEHHCNKRSCCFAKYTVHSCYDEEKSWCDEFGVCNILASWQSINPDNDTTSTPKNLQDELEAVCSEKNIQADKGQSCLAACEPNECCYVHGPKYCFEGNEIMCSQFQICKNLFTAIP